MMAVQIAYQDVPAEVSTIAAYEWQPGSRPVMLPVSIARSGAQVLLAMDVRGEAVVAFQRSDGLYLLDGPFSPRSDAPERPLDRTWRRTVSGRGMPSGVGTAPMAWLSDGGAAGDRWPQCWSNQDATWDCMGVATGSSGVAVVMSGEGVMAAAVAPGATPVLRASRWGRLVIASDRSGRPSAGLRLTAARAVPPAPQRVPRVRLETVTLSDVRVTPLGSGVAWIAGDSSPPDSWVEARSEESGPTYAPLEEVAAVGPLLPVRIALDDSRSVEAAVVGSRGEPAAGTLVTIYRLIDPSSFRSDGRDRPPRRVFAGEALADADGVARIDGLGTADYEIVAWHSALGRATMPLPVGAGRLTVHLRSPGLARGRVLAGGKPLAEVDVISVPDPIAFAAAQDPLQVKGGDARTGADGRFAIALAPGGGGELRIGGGSYAVRRVPLPISPLPIVELGDIEIGRAPAFSVVLDQDVPCDLRATGPIGRAGLQIVRATRAGPGMFTIALPEEGAWEFGLVCGRDERILAPSIVEIAGGRREVRLAVR